MLFLNEKSINNESSEVKKIIALSPQETAVAPNLSVRENLELIYGVYGFSKAKTVQKIQQLSETLSLVGVLDKRASKLSGGYARRLSIVMVLISEP